MFIAAGRMFLAFLLAKRVFVSSQEYVFLYFC